MAQGDGQCVVVVRGPGPQPSNRQLPMLELPIPVSHIVMHGQHVTVHLDVYWRKALEYDIQ